MWYSQLICYFLNFSIIFLGLGWVVESDLILTQIFIISDDENGIKSDSGEHQGEDMFCEKQRK
jgi:hypothetical protein